MHVTHADTHGHPSVAWAEDLVFLLAVLGGEDHGCLDRDHD